MRSSQVHDRGLEPAFRAASSAIGNVASQRALAPDDRNGSEFCLALGQGAPVDGIRIRPTAHWALQPTPSRNVDRCVLAAALRGSR